MEAWYPMSDDSMGAFFEVAEGPSVLPPEPSVYGAWSSL